MRTREDLIREIEAEQRQWRDLVAEVGRDRMNDPGPMGEWTFKDLTGHLAGWRDRTIDRLTAPIDRRKEPATPWPSRMDDDDTINAWIRERDTRRSLDEILADYDASFDRLAAAIRSLPDDALFTPGYFKWMGAKAVVDGDFFGHLHEEHEPSIRQWLAVRTRVAGGPQPWRAGTT